ncbi:hypothetical protein [Stieleria varia]|uniref:Uncharacterized protein n=1 Tax=Stieleria varia TaxID=2528005 RepID=A0A5C6A4X4_9BACT|nr:hypothetical protein [Stieleria varia]TWT94486.1 hypothetical protein Pla52n_53070 [Stieleria varia]
MTYLLVALGALAVLAVLWGVVHPLVCLVQCVISSENSNGQKAFWFLFTLLTGSLGSTLYGLFGTWSSGLRRFTAGLVASNLLMIGGIMGWLHQHPEMMDEVQAMAGPRMQWGEGQSVLGDLAITPASYSEGEREAGDLSFEAATQESGWMTAENANSEMSSDSGSDKTELKLDELQKTISGLQQEVQQELQSSRGLEPAVTRTMPLPTPEPASQKLAPLPRKAPPRFIPQGPRVQSNPFAQ